MKVRIGEVAKAASDFLRERKPLQEANYSRKLTRNKFLSNQAASLL